MMGSSVIPDCGKGQGDSQRSCPPTISHLEEVVVDRINSFLGSLEQKHIFEQGDNLNFRVLHFRCWQDTHGNIPTEHTYLRIVLFKTKGKMILGGSLFSSDFLFNAINGPIFNC